MRLPWREEDSDSPAWPGLVDIFAFTMVLMVLLSTQALKGTNQEVNRLQAELEDCEKRVSAMRTEIASYEKTLEALEISREERLTLEERLQAQGKRLINELAASLTSELGKLGVFHEINPDALEIKIEKFMDRDISFDRGQYDLSLEDEAILQQFAPTLLKVIKDRPVVILINGRADPLPYRYTPQRPPRDNIELSALRAATVAKLMEASARGISKWIQVVGLGETGELVLGTDPERAEEIYRQYRRVSFTIRVNKYAMIGALSSQP